MNARRLVAAVAAVLLPAGHAAAEALNDVTAPGLDTSRPYLGVVYGLVTLACICVLGFRNSRRTQVD